MTALSSAGNADGAGGVPLGGGGVYAQSGNPGGTEAAPCGGFCALAVMLEADADAMRAKANAVIE